MTSPAANTRSKTGEGHEPILPTPILPAPAGPSAPAPQTSQLPISTGGFPLGPFHGTGDQDVAAWLTRFQRVREANGWEDKRANAALKASLQGAAEHWLAAQDDSALYSVDKTATALKAAFSPVNAQLLLAHRAKAFKQAPGQAVEAYAAEMAAICRRIDPAMPPRERAGYLVDGLLPALQEHLLSQLPGELDFDKLVAAARARQAALAATASTSKIEHVAAVTAGNPNAPHTSTDRELLQRMVNRLDSMAERLHRLELTARDSPNDHQAHTSRHPGRDDRSAGQGARQDNYMQRPNRPYDERHAGRAWRHHDRSTGPRERAHDGDREERDRHNYDRRDRGAPPQQWEPTGRTDRGHFFH